MLTRTLFCIFFVSALILSFAYAGEIKLTTYYPSPLGEYSRLVCKTLGVGDNNGDGTVNSTDAPDPATNQGDVWIKGRVGMGTTSPLANLHIVGDIANPNANNRLVDIMVSGYGNAIPARLHLYRANGNFSAPTGIKSGDYLGGIFIGGLPIGSTMMTPTVLMGAAATQDWSAGNHGTALTFSTNWPSEHMRLDQNGNVGIGTGSPLGKLDVWGTVAPATPGGDPTHMGTIRIMDSAAWGAVGQNDVGGLEFKCYSLGSGDGFRLINKDLGTGETPLIIQRRSNSASWTDAMTILGTNGNVGIGTTSPTAALHLKAGTFSAGTAPLKLSNGALLTTPEVGAIEYNNQLFFTPSFGARQCLSGVIFTQTSTQSVSGTIMTTLFGSGTGYGLTLPANFFIVGKTIRLTMRGYWQESTSVSDTVTLNIYLGGTSIGGQVFNVSKFGNDSGWELSYIITCRTSGTSGTVYAQGYADFSANNGAYPVPHVRIDLVSGAGIGAHTIDTTISQVLDVKAKWTTGGTYAYIRSTNAIVEVLN